MKKVVYTAIYGGKDQLNDIGIMSPDVCYYAFTDDASLQSKTWKVIHRPIGFCSDPRLMSRLFKMRPHLFLSDYKRSLWIDGNWQIIGDVNQIFDGFNDKLYAVLPPTQEPLIGFNKYDLYDEARHCILWQKDDPYVIERQAKSYHAEGHPKKFGLWRLSVMLRSHNHATMIALGDGWWEEYLRWSCRDQISFPYVVWKMKLKVPFIIKPKIYEKVFQKTQHLF